MIYKFGNGLFFQILQQIKRRSLRKNNVLMCCILWKDPWDILDTIWWRWLSCKLLRDYKIKVFYRKQEWNDVKRQFYQIIGISRYAMIAQGAHSTHLWLIGDLLQLVFHSLISFAVRKWINTVMAHDLENTNRKTMCLKTNPQIANKIEQFAFYFLFWLR